jgi:hypothetical protein
MLKQFIFSHWSEQNKNYEGFILSFEEKNKIKNSILPLLLIPIPKVQMSVALVISSIGKYDFPDNWQELLPVLIHGGEHPNSLLEREGCMKVLELMIEDVEMASYQPEVFSLVFSILSSASLIFDKFLSLKSSNTNTSLEQFESVLRENFLSFPIICSALAVFQDILKTKNLQSKSEKERAKIDEKAFLQLVIRVFGFCGCFIQVVVGLLNEKNVEKTPFSICLESVYVCRIFFEFIYVTFFESFLHQ